MFLCDARVCVAEQGGLSLLLPRLAQRVLGKGRKMHSRATSEKSLAPLIHTHTHTHTILVGYCGTVWLQLKTEGRGLSLSLRSDWNCSLAVLLLADRMKQDILSGTGLPVENVCFDKMKYTLGLIQNTWKAGTSLVSYISHVLRSCMRQPLTFLQLYVCEGCLCFSSQLGLF